MKAWVSYKDGEGKLRSYNTPCRKIYHLARRIAHLARRKPVSTGKYATEITIRIERDPIRKPQ